MLKKNLGVLCKSVYCTKVASKLARTYTDRHGLKELCKELLNIEISKQQQSSDWGKVNYQKVKSITQLMMFYIYMKLKKN